MRCIKISVKNIKFGKKRVKTTTISIYPEHKELLQTILDKGFFKSTSEIIRFCITAAVPDLLDALNKLCNQEFIHIDNTYVRIIRRLE